MKRPPATPPRRAHPPHGASPEEIAEFKAWEAANPKVDEDMSVPRATLARLVAVSGAVMKLLRTEYKDADGDIATPDTPCWNALADAIEVEDADVIVCTCRGDLRGWNHLPTCPKWTGEEDDAKAAAADRDLGDCTFTERESAIKTLREICALVEHDSPVYCLAAEEWASLAHEQRRAPKFDGDLAECLDYLASKAPDMVLMRGMLESLVDQVRANEQERSPDVRESRMRVMLERLLLANELSASPAAEVRALLGACPKCRSPAGHHKLSCPEREGRLSLPATQNADGSFTIGLMMTEEERQRETTAAPSNDLYYACIGGIEGCTNSSAAHGPCDLCVAVLALARTQALFLAGKACVDAWDRDEGITEACEVMRKLVYP